MSNSEIKYGVCPICGGTGRMPCPDRFREYGIKHGWYDYDKEDDTVTCTNCGGQYQWGTPTGKVRLNREGSPCVHKYSNVRTVGRCLTEYTCENCGDSYQIDSGD